MTISKKDTNTLPEPTYRFVQECLSSVPVIILGSGHSAAFGIPGMEKLTQYLRKEVPKDIKDDDRPTWNKFVEAIKVFPLEDALHKVPLGPFLTDLVIRKTWEYITPADRQLLAQVVENPSMLPLSQLYTYLFRSTHKRLSIVTTNYDRLAEYAVDVVNCAWTTGFGCGYVGYHRANQIIRIYRNQNEVRMVEIWKVHGSLDWFRAPDGSLFSLPSITSPQEGFTPVIVTPGIDKYRRTHEEPFRTIITGADRAIDSGNSFFCIGYGFNDEHIQPKLIEKCCRQDKSIVVLTKQLTNSAKKVLLDGRCKRFIAFEEVGNGTRLFTPDYQEGIVLEGLNLWSLGELLEKVL